MKRNADEIEPVFVSRSDEEEKPNKKTIQNTKASYVAEFEHNVIDSIPIPTEIQLIFDKNHQSTDHLTSGEASTN